MDRRNFLKNSTYGMVGAGVLGKESIFTAGEAQQDSGPKIKEYRTLGRTGFKVSDISAGFVQEEGILSALLDTGINYIDTGETYLNGGHERIIGRVLKNRDRKKIFVTTKLVVDPRRAQYTGIKDITREGILKRFYQALERLQTDYVDCLMMHNDTVANLKNEAFHSVAKQLKAEGRLKYIGIANHGYFSPAYESREPMEDVFLAAAEDGRFDVFLLVYNYLNREQGEKVMRVCKDKGIGVTLMKTNPVGSYFGMKENIARLEKEGREVPESSTTALAKLQKMYDQAESFLKKYHLEDPGEIKDAAIKFCLNNSNVNSVLLTILNFDELNKFVRLSGTRLTPADTKALNLYSKSMGRFYCRHACGKCEEMCPHGVPVNTIMRYNHYFVAQGREKYAMEQYAELPSSAADQCLNCSGYCESACPYNVPIQTLLALAHQNLALT